MRPHKKLAAWTESIIMVKKIYTLTKQFPEDEKYGIVSQLRRASVSVPVNIAEGAGRNSPKEFKYFLNIALGSLSELDTLITVSSELGYINDAHLKEYEKEIERITALVSGLYKSIQT